MTNGRWTKGKSGNPAGKKPGTGHIQKIREGFAKALPDVMAVLIDKAKEGPQGANLWITLTLAEGKNREVRKVLESLGLKVNRLIRLSYGPFALATLGVGEVEEVGPRVIREQLAEHIEPENLPKGDKPQWRAPKSASSARRGPSEAVVVAEPEAQPKSRPAYKAGWAKPKPKTGHPAKPGHASKAGKTRKPAKPGPATIGATRDAGQAKAGPKRSGSPRADGRPAGPRGPNRSPSRPGSSAARPPGPRSGGGPKRRG